MTDSRPYLILDIDGVLQAPRMTYGHERTRVIEEKIPTEDVHPALWPRRFHGYGADRRRTPTITYRTHVRVSPRLFAELSVLPVQVVMLTTWLEHESSRSFLTQATAEHSWFPDAIHLPFVGRDPEDPEGAIPARWKVDALRRLLQEDPRPFIWADDDEVPIWALDVSAEFDHLPHLLIAPKSDFGLTVDHVARMGEFLDRIAGWELLARPEPHTG